MRFLLEVAVVAALVTLGWSKPFRDRFFHYAINGCLVASGHAVGPHVALRSACDAKPA